MLIKQILHRGNSGGILIMTLVFITMFLVIFTGLSGMVSRSYHQTVLQAQDEQAFQIAEAGLNYARWRLAHEPDNFNAETSTITDQFAGDLGTYDITFVAPITGSNIVDITSVGQTAAQPGRQVTLEARYSKPSLARFSSITNGDVWYGGPVGGVVHANGGIRMDGTSDSLMTSAQQTYACQPYHGCNSPFEIKPGIWGSGTTQELWDFPAPSVDYASITLDLLDMQLAADSTSTHYGDSGDYGYQIIFNSDNTYSIYTVDTLAPRVWSWWQGSWSYTSHDVGNLQLIETRSVPSNGVIYCEDNVWVRGDIRDRVTIAAGVLPDTPANNVDIIPNGNITYSGVHDGTRSFGAIAQRHILLPWSGAENIMTLDGAYIAKNGSFHRRYYPNGWGSQAHYLKNTIIRFGMLASNDIPATTWVDSGGSVVSGYQNSQTSYDTNLLYAPPPYFPNSGQYEFISWEEAQ